MKKRIVKRNTNTYLNLTPFHSGRKLASGGGFENAVTDMPGGSDVSDMASAYAGNASVSSAVKYTGKMLDAAAQNLKLASTYNIQAGIADNMSLAYSNQNLNTNDDLMQAWEQYDPLSHIRFKDVRGGNTLTRLHNSQMSELRGAEAGYSASGGAWQGAVIGGVVGKIAGNLAWTIGDAKARRLKRKLNREIDQSNAIGYDLLSEQTSDVAQKNLWRAEDNIVAEGGDLNTGLDKKFAGNAMQNIYNNGIPSTVKRYNTGGELLTFPSGKTDEGIFLFKDTPTTEQVEARNNHPSLFNKYAFEDTSTPEKTNKYTGGGNIILGPTQQENTYHSPLETLLPFIMKAQQMRQQQEERDARKLAYEEELRKEKGKQAALKAYKKLLEEEELKKAEEPVEASVQEKVVSRGPSEELYKSIMKFEGFSPRPTPDAKGLAIGYGDHNKDLIDYYLAHPKEQYTKEQGVGLIKDTMTGIWKILSENIPGWEELTPAQQDGIADAAYNSGPYAILNSKGLMEGLRDKDWNKVVRNLNRGWNQVDDKGRPLRGLRKRRNYNRLPFLYPEMTTYGVLPDGTVVNPDDLLNVDLSKPYVFENGVWKNTVEGKEDEYGNVPVFVPAQKAYGGNLFAYGNPPTKTYPKLTKEQHLKELQALAAKYPELEGISTKEFVPWLNALAGTESTYNPHARSVGKDGKKGSYVGYYQLNEKELGNDYSPDNQFKKAFKHLAGIFKNQMTKEDVLQAKKKGITPMQALYKYWNQGNRVTNWLYYNQDSEDGAGTLISKYGNNYNPKDTYDYSNYLRDANTAPYYVLKPGDSYYKATLGARNPSLVYNATNYGVNKFPYNKQYPAYHVGDTVALVNQPVEQFRKTVKDWDATHAFGGNLYFPGGKIDDPPQGVEALKDEDMTSTVRDIESYLKSYGQSEGFKRISNNQDRYIENYFGSRFPQTVVAIKTKVLPAAAKDKKILQQDLTTAKPINVYKSLQKNAQYADGRIYINKEYLENGGPEDYEFPINFVLGHEKAHQFHDMYDNRQSPFGKRLPNLNLQMFGLFNQNNVKQNGHDEKFSEQHADLEALRYLLYKDGIYDSRGTKDVTSEDIKKLRLKYPELRPLKQHDDNELATMLNVIAMNNTGSNTSNMAAFGGKLKK